MANKIDPNKKYTRNGKRVVGIKIVEKNSAGRPVTYPVKGTIILREKHLKTKYQIWSIYGEVNTAFPDPENNLLLV